MTVKSRQHFTEQAQTELAINLLTEKIPKGKRSKRFKHRNVQQMQQNNCVKRGARRQESTADQQPKTEKYDDSYTAYGSLLQGQYTFSRTQCVKVTKLTINKIEKIGINNHKMVKFHEINAKIIHF